MRALRRLFGFLVLVGVAFAGIVVYRRRFATRRERVDLYYEDGSLVSLEQGSEGAATLLSHAHDAVHAAHG
jgi:hypothetical protein